MFFRFFNLVENRVVTTAEIAVAGTAFNLVDDGLRHRTVGFQQDDYLIFSEIESRVVRSLILYVPEGKIPAAHKFFSLLKIKDMTVRRVFATSHIHVVLNVNVDDAVGGVFCEIQSAAAHGLFHEILTHIGCGVLHTSVFSVDHGTYRVEVPSPLQQIFVDGGQINLVHELLSARGKHDGDCR